MESKKNKIPQASWLGLFYLLLVTYYWHTIGATVQNLGSKPLNLLWPLLPFGSFAQSISGSFVLLSAPFVFCLFSVLRPDSVSARLLAFLSLFFGVATNYSYGKIDHPMHAWLFGAFALVFIDFQRKPKHNEVVFFYAQAALLAFYFIPGLWKAWSFLEILSSSRADSFEPLSFQIYSNATFSGSISPLGKFLAAAPAGVQTPLWICGILLELSAGYFIFQKEKPYWLPFVIAGFHLFNWLALSVNFIPLVGLAFLLFYFQPEFSDSPV